MKKLMLIVGVLMIAGGISAHGYCGYRGGYGLHGGVVVGHPYGYCAPAPVIVYPAPVYYGGGYGYRPAVVYRGGYHGGYYRGYRR
jgi:hypothetical protein